VATKVSPVLSKKGGKEGMSIPQWVGGRALYHTCEIECVVTTT